MKRLTEDSVIGETYIKQCASSCPYDGDFCGTDECPVLNAVTDKLGEYERAEEQGLLVRLPVPIGTIVYCIYTSMTGKNATILADRFTVDMCNPWGTFVFATKEEAEKKLEEMKNDGSKK